MYFELKLRKSIEILNEIFQKFNNIGIAFSGGSDSLLCLHLVYNVLKKQIPVIFIDTGFHFQETYEYVFRLKEFWNLDLKIYKPVEKFFNSHNPSKCCFVNKVQPLYKAITELDLDCLIVGNRWDENPERHNLNYLELVDYPKFHYRTYPILHWSALDVKLFIQKHNLPINPLYLKGYTSIDCKPCTKPCNKLDRSGRNVEKEKVMNYLKKLGYF